MRIISTLRDIILWLAIPFQKLLQKWSRPEPEMTREQVDLVLNKIIPGDLLVSYEGGRLTSPFIKGIWDHLVVITDNVKVIEAVSPKVRIQDTEEWLFKKKGVALIRYTKETQINGEPIQYKVSQFVKKFINWPYDYLFKYGNTSAYCSEIGYLSYLEYDKDFMMHKKGREILPQDFYDAAQKSLSNLKIIAEVRN